MTTEPIYGEKKVRDEKKPEAHCEGGACPLVSPPSCGKVPGKRLLGFFVAVSPLQASLYSGEACLLLHERTWHETHQ